MEPKTRGSLTGRALSRGRNQCASDWVSGLKVLVRQRAIRGASPLLRPHRQRRRLLRHSAESPGAVAADCSCLRATETLTSSSACRSCILRKPFDAGIVQRNRMCSNHAGIIEFPRLVLGSSIPYDFLVTKDFNGAEIPLEVAGVGVRFRQFRRRDLRIMLSGCRRSVAKPSCSSKRVIGSFALKSCEAIVERPRWLVMFPRTSALGTPAFRQSVGISTSLR